MTTEEHRAAVEGFFEGDDPELKGSLDEALYSMSELSLWADYVDCVSGQQALLCWKIVEKMRTSEFPEHLRM